MSVLFRVLLLWGLSLILSACLLTRSQVREQEQKNELQTKVAESQAKYADVDEALRMLRGRLEVLENERNIRAQREMEMEEAKAVEQKRVDERFQLFQEALTSMEKKLNEMSKSIEELKKKALAAAEKKKASKNKGIFERADDELKSKNYKQAILGFEEYRKKYPKGRRYRQATFKIGESFQALGLKDEAKAFYKEVVEKFPKSESAAQAKTRLKKLK